MKFSDALLQFPLRRPKLLIVLMTALTLLLAGMIISVRVDTDPENMLAEDEAVRVFHHLTKKEFALHDMVVLGVVNETHPDGVFNPATLKHVQELTEFAATLSDPKNPDKRVVARNIIAPGTVDTIEQAGPGQVRFRWLMEEAPADRAGALAIRDQALGNPLFKGTLVSEDGKALCLYLPLTSKDFAHQVRERLLEKTGTMSGEDSFYITGLPVAEDTFGVEMFIQMAISAPLAMLAIFLLMLLFFKKIKMVLAPMILAMATVFCTMGLLIGTGNTLHIMTSMIPIFLMPIAVVDSIHILSEFFDSYPAIGDRRKTIERVMGQLFAPMLFTSLTSAAGFASLILTPIPPVQVFGLFVAIGILLAWLLTILFIPAYIMLLPAGSLGSPRNKPDAKEPAVFLGRPLDWLRGFTFRRAKLIVSLAVLTLLVAAYGISLIKINDNPVKWFTPNHPIRVADRVLNSHFAGTYEAYLVLEGVEQTADVATLAGLLDSELKRRAPAGGGAVLDQALSLSGAARQTATDPEDFLNRAETALEEAQNNATDPDYETWAGFLDGLAAVANRGQIFVRPELLTYISGLQAHLTATGAVGKSNSVADLVKKVHQELYEGKPEQYRIPETVAAVAQCLISFQGSHKPDDLFHLVTPDYRKANLWIQLKSGDNQEMEKVVAAVDRYLADNPPPMALTPQWAGLTYINVVWQDKMVTGMRDSFLGSFVIVLLMMVVLFRSLLWGLLAMIPLTVTISLIYGIIGLIGKDYDMPVAVLSSLTLGLAIDFAIHFLQRSRMIYQKTGSWPKTMEEMFTEPARAISRNVIVIAVGFTPLLAAPLVPYQTVGVFLASIMAISGIATMFILPALITLLERQLFKKIPVAGQPEGEQS
jgi:hypothetical protein